MAEKTKAKAKGKQSARSNGSSQPAAKNGAPPRRIFKMEDAPAPETDLGGIEIFGKTYAFASEPNVSKDTLAEIRRIDAWLQDREGGEAELDQWEEATTALDALAVLTLTVLVDIPADVVNQLTFRQHMFVRACWEKATGSETEAAPAE